MRHTSGTTQRALKKAVLPALPCCIDYGVALFVCPEAEGSSPPTGTTDGLEQRVVCVVVDSDRVWSLEMNQV